MLVFQKVHTTVKNQIEILSVHMIKFLKFKKCLSILEKQLSKGTTKGEKYLLDIK